MHLLTPASTRSTATDSSTAKTVIPDGNNTRSNFRGYSVTAQLPFVTNQLKIEDVSGDPQYMGKDWVVSKPDYVTFPKE